MIRTALCASVALTVLAATGCASANRIVGHNLKEVGQWYGELGVTGHLNEITIRSGSRLTKLSIIGDANHVVVEDQTTLGKIEVWGSNNTISIPEDLVVRVNQVGKGTQIVRRPPAASAEPVMEPAAVPTFEEPAGSAEGADEFE
jgi:hypothetical protein